MHGQQNKKKFSLLLFVPRCSSFNCH